MDLRTSDRVVDLIEEGIDVAIRLGWLQDSSLRAVKFGEFEQFVVASPDYIRRVKNPESPEDLVALAAKVRSFVDFYRQYLDSIDKVSNLS